MASSTVLSARSNARTTVTPDELSQALKIEVYDQKGKTVALGELTKGKRSVLVFTRHFCKVLGSQVFRALDRNLY